MSDEIQETEVNSSRSGSTDESAAFRVVVVSGVNKGLEIDVDPTSSVLVGQSPACQLRLTDPRVSRRHLELETRGALLHLRDLGSSNGTTVGTVRAVEVLLRGGEQVSIGSTVLAITRRDVPAPALARDTRFGDLIGGSAAMRRLHPRLARLASTNIPVLVEGETGTGKEVAVRSIHEASTRKQGPFVIFDASAVAPSLIESELFGHERGAFTGASAQRKGVFERASGGTLFLDEIGELPLDLQARLLRAIERSEVQRVGGSEWIRCDVRLFAATRRDLEAMVADGRFRDDLFHRLAIARLELPPLRARLEDIPILVEHFAASIDPDGPPVPPHIVDEWMRRPWPGNVRELRNAVYRFCALGDLEDEARESSEAVTQGLPVEGPTESEIDALVRLKLPFPEARDRLMFSFERRYVAFMMEAAGNNVRKAAALSGIALRYFQLLRARSGR